MKRDFAALSGDTFDVLVIGGGIYGAWTAWDAALRGLTVALVERGDFGAATSSNNFKLVHGGLRYLQHLDFKRMRESIREQRALRRVAPHLVEPMPCLVPTYGWGLRGRPALRTALLLNDWVSHDRNDGVAAGAQLPGRRVLSAEQVRQIVPGVPEDGLTGGVIWHDAQMRSPDRMLISIMRSASERGAVLANYVAAESLIVDGHRVLGARVRDVLTGAESEVRARVTLNCAGPWVDEMLGDLLGEQPPLCPRTQAWNLVLNRLLVPDHAVGLYSAAGFSDKDRKISAGSRLIFFVPWRGRTMIGTSHRPIAAGEEPRLDDRDEKLALLEEAASAYPSANLSESDIAFAHCGVLPGTVDTGSGHVRLLKHYVLRDHSRADGVTGLISAVGVKFTTARDVAERIVDRACDQLAREAGCATALTPLHGGDLDDWDDFRSTADVPLAVPTDVRRAFLESYGTSYGEVLSVAGEDAALLQPLANTDTLGAEVLHAVRHEMALKLSDVVRRRTGIGTAGLDAADGVIDEVSTLMAGELGWSEERRNTELEETRGIYQAFPCQTTT